MNSSPIERVWSERPSATAAFLADNEHVFESLFQRRADAIWLHKVLNGQMAVLVGCHQAAFELIGARSKQQLLSMRPDELSPPLRTGGTPSAPRDSNGWRPIQAVGNFLGRLHLHGLNGADAK